MKVLLVITGLGVGGAEHMVIGLANQLIHAGHQVDIAYLKGQPQLYINPKIKLIHLGLDHAFTLPRAVKRLRQHIKHGQYDVVHAHLFHAILISRAVRWLERFYLISTAHSKAIGGQARAWLYRLTDHLSDLNTNVSHEATAHFIAEQAFSVGRSTTVVNGIDTTHFCFSEQQRVAMRTQYNIGSAPVVIAIGRFNAAKDYPNLLRAFAEVKCTHHDAQLYIIGDGELRAEIEQLVIQLELSGAVFLMGIQHNITEWLCMADLLVLSSAWEGFGLVVAEAMSCERMVVATDCGGVKEVMGNLDFLVPPQQSQALAAKINHALQLPKDERLAIGKRNRLHIQTHYSAEAALQQWLGLYQYAIQQNVSRT